MIEIVAGEGELFRVTKRIAVINPVFHIVTEKNEFLHRIDGSTAIFRLITKY
jgi:hypothetical protein